MNWWSKLWVSEEPPAEADDSVIAREMGEQFIQEECEFVGQANATCDDERARYIEELEQENARLERQLAGLREDIKRVRDYDRMQGQAAQLTAEVKWLRIRLQQAGVPES